MKKAMEEKEDYLNATLAMKESELQIALERIKFIEVKSNKEKGIKCENCDQLFKTKTGLRGHNNKQHEGSCQKGKQTQTDELDKDKRENNQLKESLDNAEGIIKDLSRMNELNN